MIAQDRLAQEINSEVASLMNQLIVNPLLAVIIIAAGDGIVTQ